MLVFDFGEFDHRRGWLDRLQCLSREEMRDLIDVFLIGARFVMRREFGKL